MEDASRARMDSLHGEHQELLIEFLNNDLDLGFSFLMRATMTDSEARLSLIEKARDALRAIREFTGKIQARDEWQRIHSRADQLEDAISLASMPQGNISG